MADKSAEIMAQPKESYLVLVCEPKSVPTFQERDKPKNGSEDLGEICSSDLHDNSNSGSVLDKSLMPDPAIQLLLSTYSTLFQNRKPGQKKKTVWQQVQAVFKAKGYTYTCAQLINKWHTLERGLKRVIENSQEKSLVTCSYQRELEEVLAKCPELFPAYFSFPEGKRSKSKYLKVVTSNKRRNERLQDSRSDDSGNSSPADSDDDERSRLPKIHIVSKCTVAEMEPNSCSSISSQLSNSSDVKKKSNALTEELIKFKSMFKACIENEEKQTHLFHAEKMQLFHEMMGSPTLPNVGRNVKTRKYKRRRK